MDISGKVRKFAGDKTFIPFRYPGQYEDAETGLYYNRFRYYSPDEGLYISKDPLGLGGGTNLYAYVKDTTTQVDVLGWMPWGEFMNKAWADVQIGDAPAQTFESIPGVGHAEINGLEHYMDNGGFAGQHVTISNVKGDFNPGGIKDVGICTKCRQGILEHLREGEAKSVTMPVTIGKKFQHNVTIPSEKFDTLIDGLKAINASDKTDPVKSNEAWKLIKKHDTCH